MGPPIYYSPGEGQFNRYAMSSDTSSDDNQSVPPFIWSWQESLLVIPLVIIVIVTIIGNFLVLYSAATRSRTLRLPTHYLIANLALADFLVGVLVMPFLTVLQLTGRWYFGAVYCESWTVIHFWLCSASILSTCGVCIERYIGVRFPLKHKQILNTQRIWGMIVCIWTLAGLLSVASLYIWPQPKSGLPYACDINQQIGHVILAVVGILYVPAVIMIVLYLKIYVLASRHLNFMKKHSSIAIATPSTSSTDQQQSKGFARFFKSKSTQLQNLEDPSSSETSVSISTSTSSSGESHADFKQSSNPVPNRISVVSQKKDSAISTTSTTTIVSSSAQSNWNSSAESNIKRRKQINLAKKLSLLVGILLATYLPFFTLYLVMAFHPGSIDGRVFNAFGWIRYFNSCINPFIYAFAVPDYRKAMKNIVLNGLEKLGVTGGKTAT